MFVGNVLLAINPNNFCNCEKPFSAKEAHRHVKKQSIIIAGESGAGKTEATRHIVKFLSDSAEQELMDILNYASLILNALGNTATAKNLNSSRYTKSIEVNTFELLFLCVFKHFI